VQGADPDSAGRRQLTLKKAFQMKPSTTISAAGLAAVAATPTLTNGVASCPDGQYVPVSPQPQHINGTQS
jgi:hypothetical protein